MTNPPILMLNAPTLNEKQRETFSTYILSSATEWSLDNDHPEIEGLGLLDVTGAKMFGGEIQRHITTLRFDGHALEDMDDVTLVEIVRNRIRQAARLLEAKLEGHPGWTGAVEVTFTSEAITTTPITKEAQGVSQP